MPRKTKEQSELNDEKKLEKTVNKSKKASTKKEKTTSTKKAATKTTKAAEKVETSKKSSNTKATAKKSSKTETAKKSTTTKSAAKKTTRKKAEKVQIVEYYDLPYRYNQTIVKVLAQTPTNLFIYWDISDDDRENYKKTYGDNFFETTKPILTVYNDTLNYSFEVEINDFANSWYLHVNDSKCEYRIELGRKPIYRNDFKEDYFYISSSNEIESPNDKILFDNNQKMVYFRNVKNNNTISKDISSFSFIRNMGKLYNIYDFYKAIYKEENVEEIYDMLNPSSKN